MKISYNRDEDIMLLEVATDRIDFAEEMGPIIVVIETIFTELLTPVMSTGVGVNLVMCVLESIMKSY